MRIAAGIILSLITLSFLDGLQHGYTVWDNPDFQRDLLLHSSYDTFTRNSLTVTFPITSDMVRDWPTTYPIPSEPAYTFVYNPTNNSESFFKGAAGAFISLVGLASLSGVVEDAPPGTVSVDNQDTGTTIMRKLAQIGVGLSGSVAGYQLGVRIHAWTGQDDLDAIAKETAFHEKARGLIYAELAQALYYFIQRYKPTSVPAYQADTDILINAARASPPSDKDMLAVHQILSQVHADPLFNTIVRPGAVSEDVSTFCDAFDFLAGLIWVLAFLVMIFPHHTRALIARFQE